MPKPTKKYTFAVIASDVVILTIREGVLHALCIQMQKAPFTGKWAVPGGLVLPTESVDHAAHRLLAEKAGIRNVYLEQLYTFGKVQRDPFGRVVSVAYFALVPSDHLQLRTTKEYAGVRWFPVHKLPGMAYDHAEVVAIAVQRLQAKLAYTNIAFNLLPKEFTLSELQQVYEVIIGKGFDKRNFRKKVLALKLVRPTGQKRVGEANRPAQLYAFTHRSIARADIL
ncbi:MAG: NUDIX domain-containing protein [Patescibacteria group bacterium]